MVTMVGINNNNNNNNNFVVRSTVSKTAARFKDNNNTQSPESVESRTSFETLKRADLVGCRVLKLDWNTLKMLCLRRK